MKYLYLDNFRGFTDTLIPLKDMNFLVGENSSGKTSVLKLLKIITSTDFLFNGVFNTKEVELGNFDSIASNNADFTIGYGNKRTSLILSFGNDNGISRPNKITCSTDNNIFYAKIGDGFIEYTNTFEEIISKQDYHKILLDIHRNFKGKLEHKSSPKYKYESMFTIPRIVGFENQVFSLDNEKTIWISPIRAEPKRIYENLQYGYSPDGSHIPLVLNEILNDKEHKLSIELSKILKKFGKESGLFKEIKPARFNKENKKSPFELNVVLDKEDLKISNVGYGVSQVLPVIVEGCIQEKETTYCIQQPEVHLHPKAQAALGAFFYDMVESQDKQFLIETHSDFLIDRFRLKIKQAESKKVKAQVLYFERTATGNKCTPIEIEDNGKYSEKDQPASFQEFFINELSSMLEL